jgi:glycosyltransferase involved in cell wall biosynthesis
MPTAGRRRWVPRAIRYFLRQDYPNRELVILDDEEGAAEDLIPADSRIRYKKLRGSRTLGAKRNLCVAESRGDLILLW